GPKTSIVLIGSIEGVSKDTRWDPGALTDTLRKADRVMFPSMVGLTASPFAIFGIIWQARKMATLPKGQTLAQFMPADQFQRLVALKNRGVLKAGFERSHPLVVAEDLRDAAKGKRGYGPGAGQYVERAAKKYKLKRVPITSYKAKPILKDFFASPPRNYVPCLLSAVTLAEAGPGAIKEHSDAWAQRRVPDVLASPAEKTAEACSPKNWGIIPNTDLRPLMRRLMTEPQLTVAVVSLGSLARPGGVLDDLAAAGFDIQGPRWKR
ncbi:MAG TPA: TraB/GumN family protein, partial [Allosphingosinicella sp.]